MSKASSLGAGRFGSGGQTVSSRRAAVAAATGVPTEGVAPPTELPINRISLNPDNPRLTLGSLAGLAGSLRDHGQKQAITVMNRDAYVKANPKHENDLEPGTTYVVVDGSSRLAAAREAGLRFLKVMVDDEQGADEDALLESALVANIHRQDLDPLDEAKALQRLKSIHGTQEALAKRLHRSQGWVSQRLALLDLTPELQERVGKDPIDLLRAVGKKPAEEQERTLQHLKQQREQKGAKKAAQPSPALGPDAHYDVMNQTPPAGEAPQPVPEPRTSGPSAPAEATVGRRQIKMPWDDGVGCAEIAITKMSRTERGRMLERLLEQQRLEEAAAKAGSSD